MANSRPPSYEESHPIGNNVPKRETLDSFSGRSKHCLTASRIKPGDLFTFPEDESDVMVFTCGSTRLVVVKKAGEDCYFPIAFLYSEIRDKDDCIVKKEFSKRIAALHSDAEIIRALLGHSIMCITGATYKKNSFNSETGKYDCTVTTAGQILDFVLLDPPLNNGIWYETDKARPGRVSETYVKMSNQLDKLMTGGESSMRTYLENHHGLSSKDKICLSFENGYKLDDEGKLPTTIAIKNSTGEYTILRDVQLTIYPMLLLEKITEAGIYVGIFGIRRITTLKQLLDGMKVVIEVLKLPIPGNNYRFIPERLADDKIADDVGKLAYFNFDDSIHLKRQKIPKELIDREYTLVGVNYRAPHSITCNQNCILFAVDDNPYDSNAIEVRRWFPVTTDKVNSNVRDGIYEWGFISRKENSELHRYMMEHSCRILFGKTNKFGKIVILGGIEKFVKGSLRGYAIPVNIVQFIDFE